MNERMLRFAGYCALISCLGLLGCSWVEYARPDEPPLDADIYAVYDQVQVNKADSADVLSVVGRAKHELVSQSKSVIAAAGVTKRGWKTWFTMVGFAEDELIARRKYVLISDERPKKLFVLPWEGLWFDCEMVMDSKVLAEPYANENARRIAILKAIMEKTRADIKEVAADNQTLEVGGGMINQAFETALTVLSASPARAAELSNLDGLSFQHTSFTKAQLRVAIGGNIAVVKMRLGAAVADWNKPRTTVVSAAPSGK